MSLSEVWNRLQPGAQASRHGHSSMLQETIWIPAIRFSATMTGCALSIAVLPNGNPLLLTGLKKRNYLPPLRSPRNHLQPPRRKKDCTNHNAEETESNSRDYSPKSAKAAPRTAPKKSTEATTLTTPHKKQMIDPQTPAKRQRAEFSEAVIIDFG